MQKESFAKPHEGVTSPAMAFGMSENLKNIIGDMREHINKATVLRIKEDTRGWEYGGPEFKELVNSLKSSLIKEGYNVRGCTVWHFLRGANIGNTTEGLILLLINGTANLIPAEPLTPESYLYIKNGRSFVTGAEGADIAFVVLEPEGGKKISNMQTSSNADFRPIAQST